MSLHGVGSAAADTIEQATTDPAGEAISRRAGRGTASLTGDWIQGESP